MSNQCTTQSSPLPLRPSHYPRRTLIIPLVNHILIIIKTAEPEPEQDRLQRQGDGRRAPDPNQIRVPGDGDQDLAERAGQGVHEEEDGHDQAAHAGRGAGVGELVRRHVAETLGDGAQHGVGDLPPDAERGDGVAGRGVVAAGRGAVDAPLDQGADEAGEGGDGEADGEAGDAAELDAVAGEAGVEDVAEEGDGDDDGEGVEVVEEVVGRAVGDHRGALVGGYGADAAVVHDPDGEVEEDLGGHCSGFLVQLEGTGI